MIFGYIKANSDKQTELQKRIINNYCISNNLHIDIWIEDKKNSINEFDRGKLYEIIHEMSRGDILICSEVSKLGRNLMMIMSFLSICMKNNIQVWSANEEYKIGNSLNYKALSFAFNLTANIERNIISNRTKEALAKKKADGYKLGRPKSDVPYPKKLDGKETEVIELFSKGLNMSEIANNLNVSRTTLYTHLKRKKIKIPTLKRGRRKSVTAKVNT